MCGSHAECSAYSGGLGKGRAYPAPLEKTVGLSLPHHWPESAAFCLIWAGPYPVRGIHSLWKDTCFSWRVDLNRETFPSTTTIVKIEQKTPFSSTDTFSYYVGTLILLCFHINQPTKAARNFCQMAAIKSLR